ncbi:MAG: LAGLIDADG family homing endonuclease [Candidatus Woesearchaeota archaeon]
MLKFNRDLSIIHAYLSADGYVIKNPKTQKRKYYYIGFRNTNERLLQDFEERFYNYFKIKKIRAIAYLKPKGFSLTAIAFIADSKKTQSVFREQKIPKGIF